jgi:thioredoxin 1
MKKLATVVTIASLMISQAFSFDHLHSVKEFEETIKKGNVIVDFYASWCNPCKEMEKNLKQLSSEKKDIKIYKVDIEKSKELVGRYGTPQVPALLYIKDGEILQGYVGLKPMEELHHDMQKYFEKKEG